MDGKILLIKIGAMGDVLRTTPLLHALKEKAPHCHITWVTRSESVELLQNNPLLDRCIALGAQDSRFLVETFDTVICLDKDPEATSLASLVQAPRKYGFLMDSRSGNLCPANEAARYIFRLGFDDELKFRQNRKTYQEIIFEAVGLPYKRQEYIYVMTPEEKRFAEEFRTRHKVDRGNPVVGLNSGAGPVFATKRWAKEKFVQLAERLWAEYRYRCVLFGGPHEVEKNQWILANARAPIVDAGCGNTLRQFAALIDLCDILVASDTIAMHLAIALQKKVVALFGPTCEQEVDLYDRGRKLFVGASCAPCYRSSCENNPNCMDMISAEDVLRTVLELSGD